MNESLLVFAVIVALFGVFLFGDARKAFNRYARISTLADDRNELHDDEGTTTVRGPVTVSKPAVPDRAPPADADSTDGQPALWAWRIRRKERRGSGKRGRTRWRTVEGGLAVGEFAIRESGEDVRVDAESMQSNDTGLLDGGFDPFEASNLYLGDPEEEIPLGELDPINRRLERWGLTGEDGLLSGWEVTMSIGRQTMTPDRYQATIVREGQELLVHGELDETDETPVLRGTAETPLVVALGDLEETAGRIRSDARKKAAIGVGVLAIAIVIAAAGVL